MARTTFEEAHGAALESRLVSANDTATGFPIQNLPLSRFRRIGLVECRGTVWPARAAM